MPFPHWNSVEVHALLVQFLSSSLLSPQSSYVSQTSNCLMQLPFSHSNIRTPKEVGHLGGVVVVVVGGGGVVMFAHNDGWSIEEQNQLIAGIDKLPWEFLLKQLNQNKMENPYNGPSAKMVRRKMGWVRPINSHYMIIFPTLASVTQVPLVEPIYSYYISHN